MTPGQTRRWQGSGIAMAKKRTGEKKPRRDVQGRPMKAEKR